MLIADVTGSMRARMPDGIRRIDALKDAMNKFLDQSRNEDYIGIGTFAYCKRYDPNAQMVWSYEGFSNSTGEQRNFGSLIFPLQRFEGRLNTYKSFVNSLDMDQTGGSIYINYCTDPGDAIVGGELSSTSTGAGLTIANSQFGNIFVGPGAQYQNSLAGRNPGRAARGLLPEGVEIPKYIIFMSDGEENVDPRVADEEIDDRGFSRIQTAKNTGARIYTILLGDVNNASATTLLKQIASSENNFFPAPSSDRLEEIYSEIRQTITETNTFVTSEVGLSSTISEKINASYFNILPLTDNTFRLYKSDAGQRNRIQCFGDVRANCGVSNDTTTGFDISLPKAGDTDTFEIWFKVKATQPAENINVNDITAGAATSNIRYENGYEEAVGNVFVDLLAKDPYFHTTGGGNVYTASGIAKNPIPEDRKLLESLSGQSKGIFSRNNLLLNLGGPSSLSKISNPPSWDMKLTQDINLTKYEYNNIRNPLERVKLLNDINSILGQERGIYETASSATLNATLSYPVNIPRNRHVVFVNGDLFIRNNITIPKTGAAAGTSGIIFIVKGNIGIATSVTQLHGIFMAGGAIDNSCNGSSFSGNDCLSAESGRNNPLTVEGSMISLNGGFKTERKNPANPDDPSEKFIFRPDLLLTASSIIGNVNYTWTEVEPRALAE